MLDKIPREEIKTVRNENRDEMFSKMFFVSESHETSFVHHLLTLAATSYLQQEMLNFPFSMVEFRVSMVVTLLNCYPWHCSKKRYTYALGICVRKIDGRLNVLGS